MKDSRNIKINYFLRLFVPCFILIFIFLIILNKVKMKSELEQLKNYEKVSKEGIRDVILNDLSSVVSDLLYLKESTYNHKFYKNISGDLGNVSEEYFSFAKHKKIYDQIRYIDEKGEEKIRVNYHNGAPVSIGESDLQNKIGRYYFKNTIVLDKDDIYMSPFDLNVENGKVEVPYKPMIRFGTPIFDDSGKNRGVVILNYLGRNLLNKLKNHYGYEENKRHFLLNEDDLYSFLKVYI